MEGAPISSQPQATESNPVSYWKNVIGPLPDRIKHSRKTKQLEIWKWNMEIDLSLANSQVKFAYFTAVHLINYVTFHNCLRN